MFRKVPFEYSLTTVGISLLLPASEDEHPRIVLPCYPEGHPHLLVSLALQRLPSGAYGVTGMAPMLVDHCRWYQWRRRRLEIVTESHTFIQTRTEVPDASMPGLNRKIRVLCPHAPQEVWVRNLSPGFRVFDVKRPEHPQKQLIATMFDLIPMDRLSPTYRIGTLVFGLVDVEKDEYYHVRVSIEEVPSSLPVLLRPFWLAWGIVDLSQQPEGLLGTNSIRPQNNMPFVRYHRRRSDVLFVSLSRELIVGEPLYALDVSRRGYGPATTLILMLADFKAMIASKF
ncbi:uncharacterized protein PG998_006658 [Apiospora kogelbergensis]|uniref:uncharacterized protein n=1 Tax=Apiospora kogelbergensis TaxID=1337665 RepID=UPI00312CF564